MPSRDAFTSMRRVASFHSPLSRSASVGISLKSTSRTPWLPWLRRPALRVFRSGRRPWLDRESGSPLGPEPDSNPSPDVDRLDWVEAAAAPADLPSAASGSAVLDSAASSCPPWLPPWLSAWLSAWPSLSLSLSEVRTNESSSRGLPKQLAAEILGQKEQHSVAGLVPKLPGARGQPKQLLHAPRVLDA